jgi:hypothetical protein
MYLNHFSLIHPYFGQEFIAIVELFANFLIIDFVANFIHAECGTLLISSITIHLLSMRPNVNYLV